MPYVMNLCDLLRLRNHELDIPELLRMVHEALLLRNRGASGPSSGRRVETLFFVSSSKNLLCSKVNSVKHVARNFVTRSNTAEA
jgi:hypothetical protein